MEARPKYETSAAQDEQELAAFIELLRKEGITSYLEIGARYGGSLWHIAKSMPRGSRVVVVDLPTGYGGKPEALEHLQACVAQLCVLGYDAHLFVGDSKSVKIIEDVRALGPYDCVFIDADHKLENVTKDWENYGPMARIVSFHDISYDNRRKPNEVHLLWPKIKKNYRHQEIVFHPTPHNGIGILWRE